LSIVSIAPIIPLAFAAFDDVALERDLEGLAHRATRERDYEAALGMHATLLKLRVLAADDFRTRP